MNNHNKNRGDWEKSVWENFVFDLSKKTAKEIKEKLNSTLSNKEKKNIVYRLSAIDLLKQSKSYTEIGQALWLAPQTISTIKKNFLNKDNDYRSYRSMPRKKKILGGSLDKAMQSSKRNQKYRSTGILNAWDVKEYRSKFNKPKR